MLKRTCLFSAHQKLGAKLIDFGGWEMPVQYTSITDEHLAVRKAAGIFDISHMGEVTVSGPHAAEFLNRTLTNDVNKLTPGQGQYTLMCNEHGGVIDDLYAYAKNRNNAHLPAWAAFNRAIGKSGDVGVWHETYRTREGDYETIYANMPPFGLAKATKVVTATGRRESAAGRIARS